jgi:hypothetical protein
MVTPCPVRGGDAGRGGIGVTDALKLKLADVAIDRMGLATAGLAGEEDARACLEQGKRLVLGHAICPRPRSRRQGLCPQAQSYKSHSHTLGVIPAKAGIQ